MAITGAVKRSTQQNPRISVNKLAEYLEANPTRRKKIVYDAKHPEPFVTTRYKDAREYIKSYICGETDEDAILVRIDAFNTADADSDFQEQDNNLSAEVLELLLDTDISSWDGYEISSFEGENTLVNISGVDISVNPDLLVKQEKGGETKFGLIKLHLSKTNQLSEESQKIVAVMLLGFAHKIAEEYGTPEEKMCMSFDIFKQHSECCPTAVKMRLRKIEAACEEIALWWGTL
ncbi:MAG TPA: hypothetical protein VFE54_09635 [Mucilaginibacter sp.]|jgi:hypothetical protein|nr:hypothetical protein [Mucilaginibacter sp.]